MQPPVFYAPPECCNSDTIVLPPDESRHAASVLRLRAGAIVLVIDGVGTAYRGEITSSSSRKVIVRVHAEIRDFGEPNSHITLAAGLSTGTKFDSIVQRGTELGVKRFVPLITEKSLVKVDDPRRAQARLKRLEKVALAAVKQCRRSYRPDIALPVNLQTFLGEKDPDTAAFVFHLGMDAKPFQQMPLDPATKRVTLLVGPEGGFTDDEIALAVQSGFVPVSLGTRILRTETAGPVVAALVMARLNELT